jgi:hypothetical protein
MSSTSSAMSFSAGLSQTLSQGVQQSARAIEQNAQRLDRRKEQIAEQAVQAIQSTQATAQKMDEARNKIDTFA